LPLPPLADPPDTLSRVVSLTKALPASAWLFGTLLLGNLGQTASLALRPFSRRAFRRVNRELADAWWGHSVTLSQRVNRVRIVLTGDDVPMRENAVVVANHQQMPDITFLMVFARTKDRLGDMKWFVKEQLKYVPGVGWGMVFLDCLFVKRDWAEDEASIRRTFARIVEDRVPLWLILFAEGTRLSPAKLERSRRWAEQRGLRPTEHVLQPRTKGFVASVQGLRGHLDAVYDVTIGYETGVPTLWQYIKGLCTVAHLHVRRTPVAELPRTDADLADWLQRRYQEKDRLLDHFYRHGAFPSS
jgi:1-acyl-sn-glycerol-3-phosphate acyltransferase